MPPVLLTGGTYSTPQLTTSLEVTGNGYRSPVTVTGDCNPRRQKLCKNAQPSGSLPVAGKPYRRVPEIRLNSHFIGVAPLRKCHMAWAHFMDVWDWSKCHQMSAGWMHGDINRWRPPLGLSSWLFSHWNKGFQLDLEIFSLHIIMASSSSTSSRVMSE